MPDECECECDAVVAAEPSAICESCMKSRGVQKRLQLEQLRRQGQHLHDLQPERGPGSVAARVQQRIAGDEAETADFLNGIKDCVR